MSFWRAWLAPGPEQADPAIAAIVARWRALPAPCLDQPLATQRWLVVDVETSGLDVRRDRLLAIGAVTVEGAGIGLGSSFETALRQATPSSHENILVHRIAGQEQLAGPSPAAALAHYLDYAGNAPCVAFHAAFDAAVLRRAFREHLGVDYAPRFIDLAELAPALIKGADPRLKSLDDWLDHFAITIGSRHRAAADALGTAQLLQVLLARARREGVGSAARLFRLAHAQRWLGPR